MSDRGRDRSAKQVKIHVRGQIDESWQDWFEGLEVITTEDGDTVLQGEVSDQSAVYGVIAKLRDLGLELIYIEQSE